uniref:50 kDa venom protease (Fragments) n=1 Tax=Proatheris superciliaris TaxID=110218 RepID=VMXP_PROSR|nr:RecName: Full=50 kDa venom protease; AltName: Full=Snake venom metalloproteinase; Short=SVMP [Proatheris superciliaris]
ASDVTLNSFAEDVTVGECCDCVDLTTVY